MLQCGSAIQFWKSFNQHDQEASVNIANLLRIAACVRHLLLQFETLVPLGVIHQAYCCDIQARLFSKMYVHARCFVQCYRAHYVIKLLILCS